MGWYKSKKILGTQAVVFMSSQPSLPSPVTNGQRTAPAWPGQMSSFGCVPFPVGALDFPGTVQRKPGGCSYGMSSNQNADGAVLVSWRIIFLRLGLSIMLSTGNCWSVKWILPVNSGMSCVTWSCSSCYEMLIVNSLMWLGLLIKKLYCKVYRSCHWPFTPCPYV